MTSPLHFEDASDQRDLQVDELYTIQAGITIPGPFQSPPPSPPSPPSWWVEQVLRGLGGINRHSLFFYM